MSSITKKYHQTIGMILNKQFKTKILRKIYFTKGARFTYHKRLQQQARLVSWSIAWLSILVISFSLISIVFSDNIDKFVNIIIVTGNIILSFSILVISITEDTWNKALIASEMHRCAMDLNRQYDRIEAQIDSRSTQSEVQINQGDTEQWADKYHDILARCSFNHSSVDRDRFLAENAKEIYGRGAIWSMAFAIRKSIAYFILMWASTVWAFALSIAAVYIFIWLMIT